MCKMKYISISENKQAGFYKHFVAMKHASSDNIFILYSISIIVQKPHKYHLQIYALLDKLSTA